MEGDFEQLELYRNETGHKFSEYDNCDTQKLIKSQQNVIDDLKGMQITDFVSCFLNTLFLEIFLKLFKFKFIKHENF